MQIDLAIVPSTLDAVHLGLASVIVLLTLLQIGLLTFAVIALLRRHKQSELAARTGLPAVPSPPATADADSAAKETAVEAPPSRLKEALPDSALQLLGLLQNEARFVDFVEENVTAYSDAEIGAAARVVHEGCRKVIRQYFELEPVRGEAENSRITVPKGFDASSIRLTGNIVGQPPFAGMLVHRGWRAANVKLPKLAEGHDTRIIAAAEVEL